MGGSCCQWYSGIPMSETEQADYQRIYRAVAAIPAGRVASYGQIAARAGLPGRARLVGRALRQTPDGLQLPWHRVLRADGRIALAAGGEAWREQARLLRAEGIVVHNGRIAVDRFGLDHELDRHIWGDAGI